MTFSLAAIGRLGPTSVCLPTVLAAAPAWAGPSACLTVPEEAPAEEWVAALAVATAKVGLELDWELAETCPAGGPSVQVEAEHVAVSDGQRTEEHALSALPLEARPRMGARAFTDLMAGSSATLRPLVSLDEPVEILATPERFLRPSLRFGGTVLSELLREGDAVTGLGTIELDLRLGALPLAFGVAVSVGGFSVRSGDGGGEEGCEQAYTETLEECDPDRLEFCEALADWTLETCLDGVEGLGDGATNVEVMTMMRLPLGRGRWTVRPGVGTGWRGLYGLAPSANSLAFALELDVGLALSERIGLLAGIRSRLFAAPWEEDQKDPELQVGGQVAMEWMW